jgi:predicted dienelactone hydrolase
VAAVGLVAASVPGAAAGATKTPPLTVLRETYVDRLRPSPASELQPAAPDRTLETSITFPMRARRPLPLVLLAHGSNGNPEKFTQLVETWARAGYVVVATLFPRSSDVGGNLVGDYPEQPADLSFVLDRVLAANATRRSPLRGRIDPTRIGLAGLSLGGATTYGTVFHSCCRDERIDAAILMSAVLAPFPNGVYEFRSVPTLLVHGDDDGLYPQSVEAFPQLVAPKWFVTLHGGQHANPFEDDRSPSDDVVRAVTTAFWERYLEGERAAARRIVNAVDATAGAATLQRDAS